LGTSLAAIFGTTGIASAASAKFITPAIKPGESPFKQPQGAYGAQALQQFGTIALSAVGAIPVLGLAIWAVLTGNILASILTFIVGIGLGLLTLYFGVKIGARIYDNSTAEILQKIHNFV
jgi:ABC-2 type transport system permease protein